MQLEIRRPVRAEIPEILKMMRQFAVFEHLEEFMTAEKAGLEAAIFGKDAFVEALIALQDSVAVGYALFYPHFSSFRGESGYFLEDIYVQESARGLGVGKELLRAVARLAAERGFSRIDLQVMRSNENAIKFYRSLGAVVNEDERHFKFSGSAFAELAG